MLNETRYSVNDIPEHERIINNDGEPTMVQYDDYGRSYDHYKLLFGFTDQELKGKDILDLGSCKNQKFAKGAKANEPSSVVSLDPLVEQKHQEFVVAGRSEEVPFRDASFDIIFALNSVPMYLHTPKSITKAFEESIRILKKGGRVEYFPLAYTPKGEGFRETDNTVKAIRPKLYTEDKSFFIEILGKLMEKYQDIDIEIQMVVPKNEKHPDLHKLIITKASN